MIVQDTRVGSIEHVRFLGFSSDSQYLIMVAQPDPLHLAIRAWDTERGIGCCNLLIRLAVRSNLESLQTVYSQLDTDFLVPGVRVIVRIALHILRHLPRGASTGDPLPAAVSTLHQVLDVGSNDPHPPWQLLQHVPGVCPGR